MKCLMKYEWVKLMRSRLPQGKGIMGAWMKLASRTAFRKGIATYCGYKNEVSPGMWSGGIVGIKSILGIKKKSDALLMLDKLSELGYIKYELNSENKKLTYQITDWVVKFKNYLTEEEKAKATIEKYIRDTENELNSQQSGRICCKRICVRRF